MKSLRLKLLFAGALVVALLAGYVVLKHFQLKRAVLAYREALHKRGEKTTLADFVVRFETNSRNGAPLYVAAAGRLSLPYDLLPGAMKTVAPGKARVAWAQPVLAGEKTNNVWPALVAMVQQRQSALADARAALECPVQTINLDYSQGYSLLLPHLASIKGGSQGLSAAALVDLHEGRRAEAFKNLRAQAALARNYNSEPILISFLVRLACSAIAVNTAWEALQAPGWTDAELAELEATWSGVDFFNHAELAFAMEQVMLSHTFESCRQSFQTAQSTIYSGIMGGSSSGGGSSGPSEFLRNPAAVVRRTPVGYLGWKWLWSYEDELAYARLWQAAVDATQTVKQRGTFPDAIRQFEARAAEVRREFPNAGDWGGEVVTGETMTKCLQKLANMERQRRLLVCALALKRYELRHGHAPADLLALTPEFLPSVPADPMDGKPLRYRLNPDGAPVLYSIGEDGEDNGGDPTVVISENSTIKAWWRGRDVVWPQPATAHEVTAAAAAETRTRNRPR